MHGNGDAPQQLVEHHGQTVAHQVPGEAARRPQQHMQAEADLLFPHEHIGDDHHELRHARQHSADGGTRHAHARRAELAEDEHVVEKHVHRKRHAVDRHRDVDGLHAAQHHQECGCDAVEEIRQRHDAQIGCAGLDNGGLGGEYLHHRAREQKQHQCEQQPRRGRNAQRQAGDAADGIHVLFAPVLAAQHDGAARHAEYGYGINKEHLVGQTGGRERHLAQPAQHQGIHQVDTVRNDILQRHRQCERQQAAVKRALYMNFRIFGLHGSPPASPVQKGRPAGRPFCFWEVMSV